jgi:putative membrane protein
MDRRVIEGRLEGLVRGNRFTIAIVFPLVGAVLLMASAERFLPAVLAFNPYLVLVGTLVMRLPLLAGVVPLVDRRAAALLGALTAYAYGIEIIGIATGWPYGDFRYVVDLGPMVSGVPIGLPVFFLPLVVNAYLLSLLLLGDRGRRRRIHLPAVLAVVLAIDLVLDPAAVAIGFWAYEGSGYYGVPASNYLGWLLSGTVATLTLDLAFDRGGVLNRLNTCEFVLEDLMSFVLLWELINAFYTNWVPVGLAAVLAGGIVWTDRFDFAVIGRVGATRQ